MTDEHVARLLRAAMAAPSASNQQPWRFVVIRGRSLLEAIPEVRPTSSMAPSDRYDGQRVHLDRW